MEECKECKALVEVTGICDACGEEGCDRCLIDDDGAMRHDDCVFED